jgi:NADP-dependent 3-hydroxy acid dehydrogenase YdfG
MIMSGVAPKVVLVTGVSSGIGKALARKLWNSEYRFVGTVRQHALDAMRQEGFHDNEHALLRTLDVTDYGAQAALIAEIEQRWGGVDILVNNAGISYRAVIEHMDKDNEQAQLATNYLGPMNLIRLVLPTMRAKRTGKIINISSVGGMMAMPTMGSYSASKFALEGASEALWYEMKPWNIHVSLVQPGFVHSESFRHVYTTRCAEQTTTVYDAYYQHMSRFIERLMRWSRTTPEDIAKKVICVMKKQDPPLRVQATPDAYLFSLIRRFLPRALYHRILYRSLPGIGEWGKQR